MLCPRCRREMRAPVYHYGPIKLDVGRHLVTVDNEPIALAPQQFTLLRMLLEAPERIVTNQAIWREITEEAEPQIVSVTLYHVRKKMPENAQALLHAVPGIGLMLSKEPPPCSSPTRKGRDLLGQRFGRLVVIAPSPPASNRQAQWKCHCDCGGSIIALARSLREGARISCGCAQIEQRRAALAAARSIWKSRRAPKQCAAQQ